MTLTNNLTVSGTGNLALNGVIGGAGSLTYNGDATLTLANAANSYSGGTNVVSGTVQVAADGALGSGNVTASGLGNLNYTASTTTSRAFTLNNGMVSIAAGQTLTLSGAQITGGYLNGPGVFATAGASFAGVVIRPSATINANSSLDQFRERHQRRHSQRGREPGRARDVHRHDQRRQRIDHDWFQESA